MSNTSSTELRDAAVKLTEVRAILLKYGIAESGKSYDRQVNSLINRLTLESARAGMKSGN